MKAFTTLLVLSLSFFASNRIAEAAAVPSLDSRDLKQRISQYKAISGLGADSDVFKRMTWERRLFGDSDDTLDVLDGTIPAETIVGQAAGSISLNGDDAGDNLLSTLVNVGGSILSEATNAVQNVGQGLAVSPTSVAASATASVNIDASGIPANLLDLGPLLGGSLDPSFLGVGLPPSTTLSIPMLPTPSFPSIPVILEGTTTTTTTKTTTTTPTSTPTATDNDTSSRTLTTITSTSKFLKSSVVTQTTTV